MFADILTLGPGDRNFMEGGADRPFMENNTDRRFNY